jgi:predicted membrane protein
MLVYKKLIKKNYLTSLIINTVYLFLILPAFYFMENSLFSRIWFFSLLLFYLIFYYLISRKSNS